MTFVCVCVVFRSVFIFVIGICTRKQKHCLRQSTRKMNNEKKTDREKESPKIYNKKKDRKRERGINWVTSLQLKLHKITGMKLNAIQFMDTQIHKHTFHTIHLSCNLKMMVLRATTTTKQTWKLSSSYNPVLFLFFIIQVIPFQQLQSTIFIAIRVPEHCSFFCDSVALDHHITMRDLFYYFDKKIYK